MPEIQVPQQWGDDKLSRFLRDAHQNMLTTFVRQRPKFDWLRDIHLVFATLNDNLDHTDEWPSAFFVPHVHSRYLASLRLVFCGQVPETHVMLRSCIENALYAFYFFRNEDSWSTWLSREDDAECQLRVRREFTAGAMFRCLEECSSVVHAAIKQLYDLTLTCGAHPNVIGLFGQMRLEESERTVQFTQKVLTHSGEPYELALKTSARVGLAALEVLKLIWPQRFDLLGISAQLPQLEHGL